MKPDGPPTKNTKDGPVTTSACQLDGLVGLPTGLDDECKGNTGCTPITVVECGCHCSLCDGESCLRALCDDSCMPHCPSTKPEPGETCLWNDPSHSCDFPKGSCPCGPSDLFFHWIWNCTEDYDCYPCGTDAGFPDAGP